MRTSSAIIDAVVAERAAAPMVDLRNRARLLVNLQFAYQLMVASEGLLEFALDNTTDEGLRAYFTDHLAEERGHAQWLARDLATAGVDVSAIPRSRLAVAMAGSMYYMVRHVSSACLLGYMLVLECFPPSLDIVDELERLHGVELLRTVRYHAEHDIDHGADLRNVIDVHATPEIMCCAVETARYLNEFTAEIA